jgi:phosphatidylinositol dimannoside acyltransferase
MATYLAFRLASLLLPLLPVGLGYRLASLAGDLAYLLRQRARTSVRDNLRHALSSSYPEAAIERLVRGVFRTGAKNYYDLLRLPKLRPKEIENLVQIHGWSNLEDALALGRGVILVTAHLGSFELVCQVLAARQFKVTVPAEQVQPRVLFEFVTRQRSYHGLMFVPAEVGVMRRLAKALRRNELVGLAVDRNVLSGGTPLPFFGAEASFQAGAVALARRLGSPVVAAFCIRRGDNTSEGFIEPALPMQVTDDEEVDVRVNLRTILDVLQRYITSYPDQWVAFEPVWPQNGTSDGHGPRRETR